jgi:hypothetical protein
LPFYWIHRALIDKIRPSARGLIAYNALAYFASDSAEVKSVSIPRMASRFNVSSDTIKRGLRELKDKKAIAVKEQFKTKSKKNGKREQLPNEYTLIDLGAGSPI